MIKSLLLTVIAALTVLTLTSCSDEPKPTQKEKVTKAKSVNNFGCKQENVTAPKWTCIPMVDNFYAGVGIAPKSAAGMGHMRRVALANGRSDLVQQIESQVKDKVEVFTQTTGNGTQETVDQVTTAVSKQLSQVNLQNSKGVDMWSAPSGALYMLVTVPASSINKNVKESVKETIDSSYKDDNARWQQFKSQEALDSLDKEFPSEL